STMHGSKIGGNLSLLITSMARVFRFCRSKTTARKTRNSCTTPPVYATKLGTTLRALSWSSFNRVYGVKANHRYQSTKQQSNVFKNLKIRLGTLLRLLAVQTLRCARA